MRQVHLVKKRNMGKVPTITVGTIVANRMTATANMIQNTLQYG